MSFFLGNPTLRGRFRLLVARQMPAAAQLREHPTAPQRIGYVADREAFLAECGEAHVVAPYEPGAQRAANGSPAQLESFGLGRFDHFVIGHVPLWREGVTFSTLR
jgi:hypothetical protein